MRRIASLLLLLLITVSAGAQRRFTIVEERDTTRLFQGISVGTDLLGAAQTLLGDQGHYELGVRVNLYDKYFPAFEAGYGVADKKDEYLPEKIYKTKAPYLRLGCDFNVLKNKHDIYRLYAGVRYAFSSFNYDTTTLTILTDDDGKTITDADGKPQTVCNAYNDQSGSAHWLEGLIGIDVPLWSNLHLGWDVRYKRRIAQSHGEGGKPWFVPGLGTNNNAQLWARFMVMWQF